MFLRRRFLDDNGNGGGLAAPDRCSLPHTCSPLRVGQGRRRCGAVVVLTTWRGILYPRRGFLYEGGQWAC
jgi:hypothetical protein